MCFTHTCICKNNFVMLSFPSLEIVLSVVEIHMACVNIVLWYLFLWSAGLSGSSLSLLSSTQLSMISLDVFVRIKPTAFSVRPPQFHSTLFTLIWTNT